MSDYPRIRETHTCPKCWGSKDKGMLLCWPCHHKDARNDGGYSVTTERALAAYDDLLTELGGNCDSR